MDGNTVTGYWEKSIDGHEWEHDFDVKYSKAKNPELLVQVVLLQPSFTCLHDGLGAICYLQLAENVRNIIPHRLIAEG